MALLPENVLIVYRDGNDDSYEFAQYYAAIHGIPVGQLLAVPCSGDEILSSYSDFQSQIENDVAAYLNEYIFVNCIVLSYGVPGGFQDGLSFVSSTSRLSRILSPYDGSVPNVIFNRQSYQSYNDADSLEVIIAARFDAPTLEIAKAHVDHCKTVGRTGGYANGKFYFDKVSDIEYVESDDYFLELTDFEETILPFLNMPLFETVPDTVNDVPLFRLNGDSFVWSWKSDRAGYSYFNENKYARIFCYNADSDGAYTVRNAEDRGWPMLAISSGYVACAGTIGTDTTEEDFPRPRPFFEALVRGATIGEAFYFSLPNLDNSMTLFGDPLMKVRFPIGESLDDSVTEIRGLTAMADDFASSVAFKIKSTSDMRAVRDIIGNSTDFTVEGELFLAAAQAAGASSVGYITGFGGVAQSLVDFEQPSLDDFLTNNSINVSRLINLVVGTQKISSGNISEQGSWFVDLILERDTTFDFYDFRIEVSLYRDYSSPFVSADSGMGDVGFYYEKRKDEFTAITVQGVPSNYAGRRIRYQSQSNIDAGTVMYVRMRQYSNVGDMDWVEQVRIVNT